MRNSFSKTLLAIAVAGAATVSHAGSFGLIEQSASGQGAAYAGASALGEDASTIYFNPAGMTRLSGQQISVAGHLIAPTAKYTDSGSTILTATGPQPLSGTNSETAETGIVPNFYYAADIGNEIFVGVGVNVPFGLATEYDNGWYGRYHAMRSAITSININPSIAWKATDKVSVGFGLSVQYLELELTNNIESNAACASVQAAALGFGFPAAPSCAGIAGDSSLKLDGTSTELGWNTGILIDVDDRNRVGISYRSEIKHDVSGDATYNLDPVLAAAAASVSIPNTPFNILQTTTLEATAALPETFSISYVSEITDKWTTLIDWTWTGWSNLDVITIRQAGGVPGNEPTLDLAYQNTSRFSVGAHYQLNDAWLLRGGLAHDQTPIRSARQTTPRIPGNDRNWLSLGFGWTPSSSWSIDAGYSHLFISQTDIDNGPSASSSGARLIGSYESSVDIFSVQGNFYF